MAALPEQATKLNLEEELIKLKQLFTTFSTRVEQLETGSSRFNDDIIDTTAQSYAQAIARPATTLNNNNPVIPKTIPLMDRLGPASNIIAKNSPIILTTSHLSTEDPFKRMNSRPKEEVIRKVITESCAAEIRSVSSLKSGDTIIYSEMEQEPKQLENKQIDG